MVLAREKWVEKRVYTTLSSGWYVGRSKGKIPTCANWGRGNWRHGEYLVRPYIADVGEQVSRFCIKKAFAGSPPSKGGDERQSLIPSQKCRTRKAGLATPQAMTTKGRTDD